MGVGRCSCHAYILNLNGGWALTLNHAKVVAHQHPLWDPKYDVSTQEESHAYEVSTQEESHAYPQSEWGQAMQLPRSSCKRSRRAYPREVQLPRLP